MSNEREFIEKLRQRFQSNRSPGVRVGIGDDGAVLDVSSDRSQVVVTDMLLDGVHFDLSFIDPSLAGRKAMAVNLSDLAAMGCRPTAAFISIAVPRRLTDAAAFLSSLYDGVEQIADEWQCSIAGGDTNSWDGPFTINVCLTGTPVLESPVLRSTAQPGNRLFVTGPLGGSLNRGRHLTFQPRLDEAQWLLHHVPVTAMMDISDGLAIDLSRMMEASGVGATIESASIPVHEDVAGDHDADHKLRHALTDGEDFELLVAVKASADVKQAVAERRLIEIGVVTESTALQLQDEQGNRSPLTIAGYEHL